MRVTIEPLTEGHVEPAAALLAARHQRDRGFEPRLPADLERPDATLAFVRALLDPAEAEGVVAMRDGELVGSLIGERDYRAPTDTFASFVQPRAAVIPYGGFALAGDARWDVGRELYAALAIAWVRSGVTRHYVTVPAHPEAIELWSNLGFARYVALAACPMESVIDRTGSVPGLGMRPATSDDEPAVQNLVAELFRAFGDSPVFVPDLPETAAARRLFIAGHLADPNCPTWLATIEGRVVGVQMYEEPHAEHWHQEPLTALPGSVYLHFAATTQDARGKGVGAALLGHALATMCEAGYEVCLLHYLTASRAAAFWQAMGFRPYAHWMHRTIDERAIWADGSRL